jgi:hypothetical protein
MGTTPVSNSRRRAGQHVQERADQLDHRLTAAVILAVAIPVAALLLGVRGISLSVAFLAALVIILGYVRTQAPEIGRWRRGAEGERKVGAVLEGLGPGWHVLHDVSLGRGNIDHVLVGPAGVFTIETKSHRGNFRIDHLDPHMISQAYAEKKILEKVSGLRVTPLLVFSRAFLVESPVAHVRGVTVLPARMLAGHLRRQRPVLGEAEAAEIGETLRLALEVDAASA